MPIGFSASKNIYGDLEPEHTYTFEVAYVHDVSNYLPNAELADFKIAYYNNITRNVIDRNERWQLSNSENTPLEV